MTLLNEIAQWLLLIVLLIACMTLFRQWGHIIGEDMGDITSTSGPPLHSRLRSSVLDLLMPALPAMSQREQSLLVCVSENCPSCHALLEGLSRGKYPVPESVGMGLVALTPSAGFQDALRDLPIPFVADEGKLWKALNIRATPFIIAIDREGRVQDKEVGLAINTILDRLQADESEANGSTLRVPLER